MTNVNQEDILVESYMRAIEHYTAYDYIELQRKIDEVKEEIRPLQKKLIYMEAALRLREN